MSLITQSRRTTVALTQQLSNNLLFTERIRCYRSLLCITKTISSMYMTTRISTASWPKTHLRSPTQLRIIYLNLIISSTHLLFSTSLALVLLKWRCLDIKGAEISSLPSSNFTNKTAIALCSPPTITTSASMGMVSSRKAISTHCTASYIKRWCLIPPLIRRLTRSCLTVMTSYRSLWTRMGLWCSIIKSNKSQVQILRTVLWKQLIQFASKVKIIVTQAKAERLK